MGRCVRASASGRAAYTKGPNVDESRRGRATRIQSRKDASARSTRVVSTRVVSSWAVRARGSGSNGAAESVDVEGKGEGVRNTARRAASIVQSRM